MILRVYINYIKSALLFNDTKDKTISASQKLEKPHYNYCKKKEKKFIKTPISTYGKNQQVLKSKNKKKIESLLFSSSRTSCISLIRQEYSKCGGAFQPLVDEKRIIHEGSCFYCTLRVLL